MSFTRLSGAADGADPLSGLIEQRRSFASGAWRVIGGLAKPSVTIREALPADFTLSTLMAPLSSWAPSMAAIAIIGSRDRPVRMRRPFTIEWTVCGEVFTACTGGAVYEYKVINADLT
ncbi:MULTISPECIES: hypothetical protein [unclassified Variovorax]|uniref:hypothetical protein n=1 Tax=unclassified Variovorax TaxID=663243 RepID=UPI00257567DC|nr:MULTISPECIES: hypothetical protein [unclassified Variovorax]MDM0090462.1 hypothetical protein [Variovorax sp. J22G40]MDM0147873.1 hypothetical protein [Variovorax sp. J2P1-31]